jgi:ATP-binding cassette subfamily C protein LapB
VIPAKAAQAEASAGGGRPVSVPLSSEVDFIHLLLRSLSTLLRLKGRIVSPSFLLAGLADTDKATAGACLRAATGAGFQGKILYRPELGDISVLTLPCILLLDGDHCCVLLLLGEDAAEVILPENGEEVTLISREDLAQQYCGYAIFGSLENRLDARVEKLSLVRPASWFWGVLRHFMPVYRHVAAASLVINLIAVTSPLFVMNVYDRVVPNNALETLWVLAIGISIAYAFDFLLKSLRTHFVDVAGHNADIILSSSLLDKVLSMRMEARPESTGALVNNLREFESLREFFSSSTLLALIDLPFLCIFLILIHSIGGVLVVLPLAAMPLMFVVGLLLQLRARHAAEHGHRHNMQKNALLTEIVNALETVKISLAGSRMQRLWEDVIRISAKATVTSHKYHSMAISFSTTISQMVSVGMIVWGVYLIRDNEMTMGGLIGCNILVSRAMAPLLQLAALLTRLQGSLVSLSALNAVMALPSEDQEDRICMDFGILPPAFTLEGLSFAYPGAERAALDRIHLHIGAGEKVGVIGRMGSGKSTLGKMLVGLYRPTEGAVKLGGVDIRQLSSSDLRCRVGFLPQEVVLFYGTIRDNIALGDPSINDHLVARAAELSGTAVFVKNHPAGFGAQVGEQGRNLSGGQRQAVGLARALVHDPEILILDEPTSNMDAGSEQRIQTRLASIIKDKTVLLITHRLSMLRIVDRLVVMEGGRIVRDGPREEVLRAMRERPEAPSAGGTP